MADKIVVMNGGKVEQIGHPLDLYHKPANIFVATFIGSPQMNLITGPLADHYRATTIGVRPEHFNVRAVADTGNESDRDGWRGRVASAEYLGSDTFLVVDIEGAGRLQIRTHGGLVLPIGQDVVVKPDDQFLYRFDPLGVAL